MHSGDGNLEIAPKAQDIMAAALRVITERGYAAASVREITDAAGVAAGTFYLYFPAKEAVGLSLIDTLYRRALAAAARARHHEDKAEDKLFAALGAVLQAFTEDPSLAHFVLILAPGAHPAFRERLDEVHEALGMLVRQDLDALAPTLPGDKQRLFAEALVGAAYEIVSAWVRRGAATGELEPAPEFLKLLFMSGIAPRKEMQSDA